jgi:FkbM family methyltransferase
MREEMIERTGKIEANPNPIRKADLSPGATTLTWTATGTDLVEVRVAAPNGQLLSRSGPVGTAATGEWVTNGMVFFLQDVSEGRPLTPDNTLDTVLVTFASLSDTDETRFKEKLRLRSLARYQPATTTLMGEPFRFLDAPTFLWMHQEIVEEGIYEFRTENPQPFIIVGGANIGVSVAYFKSKYPDAHVVAFEPDPAAFAAMKANVESRGYRDVKLVRGALAATDGRASFASEGSYAGRIAHEGDIANEMVETVRLRPYIDRHVDLLKLNIEGAETEVLLDCADLLHHIERIALEYHSFAKEPQTLHTLFSVLAKAGYRVYARSPECRWPRQPFIEIPVSGAMDLRLYVYAFR